MACYDSRSVVVLFSGADRFSNDIKLMIGYEPLCKLPAVLALPDARRLPGGSLDLDANDTR